MSMTILDVHLSSLGDTMFCSLFRLHELIWLGFVAFILATGCSQENVQHQHLEYPHKPDDYKQAVLRLQEIHDSLASDQRLPKARAFKTKDYDSENHSEHHVESRFQEFDSGVSSPDGEIIVVTIVDEWVDIVQWLPMIAADSNLPKDIWDKINALSEDLVQISRDYPRSDAKDFLFRYQRDADRFRIIYDQLKELFDQYDHWHPVYSF